MEVQDDPVYMYSIDNKLYKWLSRLFEFALVFTSLDPYATIKGKSGRKVRRYAWMRKHWLKASISITVYLSIKPLTVAVLSLMKSRVDDGESVLNIKRIFSFIGDPYSAIPFVNWILYALTPLATLWIRVYLPVYFRYCQPFNCSFARFILEPKLEVRSYELEASQMLKQAIESFEHDRWKPACSSRFGSHLYIGREVLLAELQRAQRQLNRMRTVRHQMQLIRPKSLLPEWHRSSYRMFALSFASLIASNPTFFVLITVSYTYTAWQGRCQQLNRSIVDKIGSVAVSLSNCKLQDVLSVPDLIVALEMVLIVAFFLISSSSIISLLHVFQVRHHVHLSECLSDKLSELLGELQDWTPDREQVRMRGESMSGPLSSHLCASIVNMWIFERESRRCVKTLAHTARYMIAVALSLTSVAFYSIGAQLPTDRQLSPTSASHPQPPGAPKSADFIYHTSTSVMYASWAVTMAFLNATLYSCAIIPARISQLDKKIYSLMAQLVRIQERSRSSNDLERLLACDRDFPTDDPITSLWRRFVLGSNFKTDLLTVRAFNIAITYKGVFTINFYTATIISLLLVHSR